MKNNFSFLYEGNKLSEAQLDAERQINEQCSEITYKIDDSLLITKKITKYEKYNAEKWVLYFENPSDHESGILENILDCDTEFDFEYDAHQPVPGFGTDPTSAKVIRMTGINWNRNEFSPAEEYLLPGQERMYTTGDGVSSQGITPFFNMTQGNHGVIAAIGWTGQWNVHFTGMENKIRMQSGIEALRFKLLPGEKIRTSSTLIMHYEGSVVSAQNKFRRLMKEHFSLIGQEGRDQQPPFCIMGWGGLHTEDMLKRIHELKANDLNPDYYWIDAAWYGSSEVECPDEMHTDWGYHVGEWYPNKNYHPDDLKDVAKAVKDNDMKLLLWMEPELVIKMSDVAKAHPEWFYKHEEEELTWLVNLSIPEAFDFAYESVATMVKSLGLSCFRQDFCFFPLKTWRNNDLPDRAGICEIKHIMGLYALWDKLLQNFPHLMIDNCAGGGRRIDIEMLSRSTPLWRTDLCGFECEPEFMQMHNTGIQSWLPYSGSGTGKIMEDTYRVRSCYSSTLTSPYWGYIDHGIDDNPSELKWAKAMIQEYRRLQPFLSCDYYPLVKYSMDSTSFCAWQFDRPETGEGVIFAFRRQECPSDRAFLELGGICDGDNISFEENHELGQISAEYQLTGEQIRKDGFKVQLDKKRSSVIIFYKKA